MQHPDKTLATYVWNICNIKTNTFATYVWKNRWNIENRHLQHTCTIIATYATSWSTFATFVRNTWNIPMKHLKHLKHALATWEARGWGIPAVRVGADAGWRAWRVGASGIGWVSGSNEAEWARNVQTECRCVGEGQRRAGGVVDACNTLGVCHQLSSGFELKHDRLSGDDDVKVNL
jgi:hypothetical protein